MKGHINCEFLQNFLFEGSNRVLILPRLTEITCYQELKGNLTWSVAEEKVISDMYGYFSDGDNFFFENFNRRIAQLVESGIVQCFVKFYREHDYTDYTGEQKPAAFSRHVEFESKVVLTMDHLLPWFIAFGILIMISCVVFVGEVILGKLKRK